MRSLPWFVAALLAGALVGSLAVAEPAQPPRAPVREPTPTLPPHGVLEGGDAQLPPPRPRSISEDGALGPSKRVCPAAEGACVQPAAAPAVDFPLASAAGYVAAEAELSWATESAGAPALELRILACKGSCGDDAIVLGRAQSQAGAMPGSPGRLTVRASLAEAPEDTMIVVQVAYVDQAPGDAQASLAQGQRFHVEARIA